MKKETNAEKSAFMRGFIFGASLLKSGIIVDYGFGFHGYGLYAYDKHYNVLFFMEDKN